MKYAELSLEKLRETSISMANTIKSKHEVDLIVFVAKAGFAIAYYMNEVFNVPLLGVEAHRKGNGLKAKLSPILAYLPCWLKDILRVIELKSNLHCKCADRSVNFFPAISEIDTCKCKKILLVDDSVDTGNSMKAVYELVAKTFANASIISYSLNVWEQSKVLFDTDYYTYLNTIIRTPMSKDSKEYDTFINLYEQLNAISNSKI